MRRFFALLGVGLIALAIGLVAWGIVATTQAAGEAWESAQWAITERKTAADRARAEIEQARQDAIRAKAEAQAAAEVAKYEAQARAAAEQARYDALAYEVAQTQATLRQELLLSHLQRGGSMPTQVSLFDRVVGGIFWGAVGFFLMVLLLAIFVQVRQYAMHRRAHGRVVRYLNEPHKMPLSTSVRSWVYSDRDPY